MATAEGAGEHVGNSRSKQNQGRHQKFTAALSFDEVKLGWHRVGTVKCIPSHVSSSQMYLKDPTTAIPRIQFGFCWGWGAEGEA